VVDRYFRAAGDQGIGCCSTLLRSLEEWPNAEQRSVEVHLSLHDGAAPVDPLAKYEKLKRLADETVMALDEGWRAQRLLGPTDPSIAIAAYVYDHPSRLPHDRYLIAGDFVISLSTGFGPAADPDEDCLLQREPPSKGTTVRRKLRDSQEARNADGSVACVCSTNARTAAAPDSL
jgi:hypothetical protein